MTVAPGGWITAGVAPTLPPMATDPIPAIAEAAATGETAALFAELRTALNVPFVNLVWRHLATIPGGLSWTWALLRPVYASPLLEATARELRDGIRLRTGPLHRLVFDNLGLHVAERQAIQAVISDYNQANSMNVLALNIAKSVLRHGLGAHPQAVPAAAARTPRAAPALPRLLGLDELSPELRALVVELDKLGRNAPNPAIASLYRHLGHWPAFLALTYSTLLPLHQDGTLWAEQERLTLRAQELIATHLQPLMQDIPPLPAGADRATILAGVESVITGRMTVMGTAMQGLLPAA